MEPILTILQILAFLVLTAALWQCWRIIRAGRGGESLSEEDNRKLLVRLTVSQVCVALEAVLSLCRILLPLILP